MAITGTPPLNRKRASDVSLIRMSCNTCSCRGMAIVGIGPCWGLRRSDGVPEGTRCGSNRDWIMPPGEVDFRPQAVFMIGGLDDGYRREADVQITSRTNNAETQSDSLARLPYSEATSSGTVPRHATKSNLQGGWTSPSVSPSSSLFLGPRLQTVVEKHLE